MNDIVSYIYDEINASERAKFETHLAVCHECTNEFAGISDARLSLFEWRRDEFADLPTPEIVIPYPAKRKAEEENVGLLSGIRGWISFVSFPVAVAAGLVVCAGLGFLLINYSGLGEQSIASNANVPTVETTIRPAVIPGVEIRKPEIAVDIVLPDKRATRQIQPVKAVEPRRPKAGKHLTARSRVNKNPDLNVSNAPVLSENYEESDDTSLRLSDLFSEVDS